MGISRRQGGARRAAGGDAHSRAGRGTGHHGRGAVPGAAHLREPRLSRVPSADAALRMPALAGLGDGARACADRLGAAQPAARIPHAAGGRTADLAFDDTAVADPAVYDSIVATLA